MAAKRTKSLKDRLIDATIRGIEKVGVENLSLRKIAADCGVTHATAYKYFENKQDLISVCCGRIAARVQAYLARSMHDAPEPYVAMCKSYLRYMVRHPQFHALLHMSPLTKQAGDPVIRALPGSRYAAQSEMIRDFLGRCGVPAVSYTHLRAHETGRNLVCRLLLEKKKKKYTSPNPRDGLLS